MPYYANRTKFGQLWQMMFVELSLYWISVGYEFVINYLSADEFLFCLHTNMIIRIKKSQPHLPSVEHGVQQQQQQQEVWKYNLLKLRHAVLRGCVTISLFSASIRHLPGALVHHYLSTHCLCAA